MPVFGRLRMPSLGGTAEWLNSEPLGPAELRGHVVLVDFWTLTCINWLRQEPYVRAWSQAYRNGRSTSSTPTASSATTTSAKDATSNRSASSSGCSASSASSSPSKGSAWRRRPTGTTCGCPRRISATGAASTSRHRRRPEGGGARAEDGP